MNSSFIIPPVDLITEDADLYIEIKAHGLSYTILENNACKALAMYHFKPGTTDEQAAGHIHSVMAEQVFLQQQFNKVFIVYGYTQTVLVPHQFMTGGDNKNLLELMFGDTKDTVINTDFVYQHSIHNIYSVPAVIEIALARYFENATSSHLYSLMPHFIKSSGTHMYCIFNTGHLTVLLQKDARLQLIQHFAYKTPEDAAYHMLNTCRSFAVDLKELTVHLSGLIDAASALYDELHKYFLNLYLEGLPEQYSYPEKISNYPAHYFSHLFAAAACV